MPLHILLILVIGGIAGIALLLHALGHSRPFDLSSAGTARNEWLRHWPTDQVAHVYLTPDAALIDTPQGPGLLRPFGADTVGHRLAALEETPRGLRLSFADFAAPAITLPLPPETRALWLRVWSESQNG